MKRGVPTRRYIRVFVCHQVGKNRALYGLFVVAVPRLPKSYKGEGR
jgi:hypothetical protein